MPEPFGKPVVFVPKNPEIGPIRAIIALTSMKKIAPTFLLLTILSSASFGQLIIRGKIVNRATQAPVPYANIGIQNSNVGTLSNLDGSFSILIPPKLATDTVHFFALGFGRRAISVRFLKQKKDLTIFLNERATVLNAVTVTGKKERNKLVELGNPAFRGGVLETDTTYAGRSVSLLIEPKEADLKKGLGNRVLKTR